MTPEQLAERLGIPWSKLCELAHNPEDLARIINIAYNEGCVDGAKKAHEGCKQMFRGYDAVLITN